MDRAEVGFASGDDVAAAMSDTELERLLDAAEREHRYWWARRAALTAEARRRRLFRRDGAYSTAKWCAAKFVTHPAHESRCVRLGAACERLPQLAERVSAGELSADQANLIAAKATPDTIEAMLDAAVREDTVHGLRYAIEQIAAVHPEPHVERRVAPGDDPDLAAQPPGSVFRPSELTATQALDGRVLLFANMTPDDGELLVRQLHALIDREPAKGPDGERIPHRRRAAQALLRLAVGESQPPSAHLVAHVHDFGPDLPLFATTGAGEMLEVAALERLGCDATVRTIVHGPAGDIGIGHRSRTIPEWLNEYIRERDGFRCRFPGCANSFWLHTHHVVRWADAGATDAGNLVTLCALHHRLVHEEAWVLAGDATRFSVRRPDGTHFADSEVHAVGCAAARDPVTSPATAQGGSVLGAMPNPDPDPDPPPLVLTDAPESSGADVSSGPSSYEALPARVIAGAAENAARSDLNRRPSSKPTSPAESRSRRRRQKK